MNVHDGPEPDDCRQHVKVADAETHDVLERGQGTVLTFSLEVFEKLFARRREPTASDHIDVAMAAFKTSLPRIFRRCRGRRGKKNKHAEIENEYGIVHCPQRLNIEHG